MKFVFLDEISPYISSIDEFFLVPEIMAQLNSEYCYSEFFDNKLIDLACYNSYFPMAGIVDNKSALILKLHKERCIINFDNFKVSKQIKKISKNYKLTFNKDFKQCIEMINKRYSDSWLVEALVNSFLEMKENPNYTTKFCSFELWDNENLVAGEVGFIVGNCYTSLSGFHNVSNTGHLQLYLTNIFLKENNFSFWDLGMELEYKLYMGGEVISGEKFLEKYSNIRDIEMDIKKLEKISLNYGE